MAAVWCWTLAATVASAVVYGVADYNLLLDARIAVPRSGYTPPLASRVLFNGFAKLAWALAISWVILACVKDRGGLVNTLLSWSVWIPLARLQYCVYLLHRTVIYLVNSRTEYPVRFSNMLLTQQFLSILAISTALAFLFVVCFEAPIVHLEKMMFSLAGVGTRNTNPKRVKQ